MVPKMPVAMEVAGWGSRQAPSLCPAVQGVQPLAAAALPESWSMALPTATKVSGEA